MDMDIDEKYIIKDDDGSLYFAGTDPIYDDPLWGDVDVAMKFDTLEKALDIQEMLNTWKHRTTIDKIHSRT